MTTFRNNIQRVNNSNSIVYNGDVYVERNNGRGAIVRTLLDKKPGERMGYIVDGGHMAAINEPNGWMLDEIIRFDDAFNHYIKSHCSLDEATSIVCDSIGIRPDDNSEWAIDLRTVIRDFIKDFDDYLEDEAYLNEEDFGDPDKLNEALSGIIFDGVVFDVDIYDIAEDIRAFKQAV
nr:MAG TPA: hypothetical protein [Caudoviricetes sp.]